MPIASEIRWGTGYDNALEFEPFPTDTTKDPKNLDDVVVWRQPAPGSRRIRNPAGVTDDWTTAADFMLAGRARWFPLRSWGGVGLQDFIDYGRSNTFRFIPDRRYPNFYVDNCYLEEPYDSPRPQLEQGDGSQSIDIVIRQQAFDFALARRGLMFEYVPGKSLTEPSSMAATFLRATTANRSSRDLVLTAQASGELRDRHFLTASQVRTALLEKASTNLVLQSENFGTTWTASGTPTRVAAGHTASGVALDLLGDDDGAGTEFYQQNIGFTGDGVKAVSIFIKQGTASSSLLRLQDDTAAANRLLAQIGWSAGVPSVTMGTGTYIGYETWADGVFRVLFATAGVIAANTNRLIVAPAETTGFSGALTGDAYLGGVQAEDSTTPTSYLKTTTTTSPRNADNLQLPFNFTPQEMTLYLKFIERGTIHIQSGKLLQIGSSADAAPRLLVYRNTNYEFLHQTSGGTTASQAAAAPAFGDTVELRCRFRSQGISLSQTINGGTEVEATGGAVNAFAAVWSDTKIWLGGLNGSSGAVVALQSVKIAASSKTLAEMRAA